MSSLISNLHLEGSCGCPAWKSQTPENSCSEGSLLCGSAAPGLHRECGTALGRGSAEQALALCIEGCLLGSSDHFRQSQERFSRADSALRKRKE